MSELSAVLVVLECLQKEGKISNVEYEYLRAAITKVMQQHKDNADRILEFDIKCFNESISMEENVERKRELLCFECPIDEKVSAKVIDALSEDGAFGENRTGLHFLEPFFQFARNIAIKRKSSLLSGGSRLLDGMSQLLIDKVFHIYTPFSDRTSVAGIIGDLVHSDDSVIFSGTPAIFNPFELDDTDWFRSRLLKSSREVVYIWNKDSVSKQISDHLSQKPFSVSELKEKYYEHFKQFAQNNLVVICGENSSINANWATLPFISKTKYIKGERINSKLAKGTLVNNNKIYNILSLLPKVGPWVKNARKAFEKGDDLLVGDYMKYRKEAIEAGGAIKLFYHDKGSVRKFVDRIFEDACR